jgi:putative FmdB family regulatory protein
MPTYEYRCENSHYYSEERSIHEKDKVVTCEICKEKLVRIWGQPPITFKGAGFNSSKG